MIAEINKAWNWKGFSAVEILRTNDFGNIIFKTDKNGFWRICPEEVSCEKISNTETELHDVMATAEFIEDWEMNRLVTLAKAHLGELAKDQKFCLKIPAVIGGKYDIENLAKVSFKELISFSGSLGFQIKDLQDGQKIILKTKN